ncbi:hypothetical protein [Streptomyces sp. NPDC006368]
MIPRDHGPRPGEVFTGRDLDGVADVDTRLRLIHGRIMPTST